ncbi:response regulator transcription factor [Clostridioides sp. ZZV15-6597]|uniref:LytR/AlgR family response regulator transcription factor n=1 Tax=Clostridioides sp. ZZV15-6597 TaxID=2811500 RepID=UPI001D100EAA|nr:response regulator transcription factor [Clostridioides sp. ZZV15-6597]
MEILLFDNDVNFGMNLKEVVDNILIKESFDCDIVKLYRNAELFLRDIKKENKIRIFFIGINFVYNLNKNLCDGLWLAQQIRNSDYVSPIVFLSSYIEMGSSIFAYKLAPMDFISKHNMDTLEERVRTCIKIVHNRYTKKIDYEENFFTIYKEHELWRISFDKIIYFETSSQSHKIKIVTVDYEIEVYDSLKNIIDLDPRLFRIHRSFIVNCQYIKLLNIKYKYVEMINGDKCPVADSSLQVIKKLFAVRQC